VGFSAHFILSGEHFVATRLLNEQRFPVGIQPGTVGSSEDRDYLSSQIAERDVVVVDGYRFDEPFYEFEAPAVVIDERPIAPDVDVFIDIDPSADAKRRDFCATQTLFGPEYALLRPQFVELRSQASSREIRGRVERVLIMLGGEDVTGQTEVVLDGLEVAQFHGVAEVISNQPLRRRPFTVDRAETVSDIGRAMLRADVAITASGGTVWELCSLGTPALVITAAENQRSITRWIADTGAAVALGWYADLTPASISREFVGFDQESRVECSRIGMAHIDGRGSHRVARALQEMFCRKAQE
jgi:spore coat polysaccharide biosynthesis predicted glycosyltransferase SpsG